MDFRTMNVELIITVIALAVIAVTFIVMLFRSRTPRTGSNRRRIENILGDKY